MWSLIWEVRTRPSSQVLGQQMDLSCSDATDSLHGAVAEACPAPSRRNLDHSNSEGPWEPGSLFPTLQLLQEEAKVLL